MPDADPHIPSLFAVYPTTDWHERETYDFFGIVFDGHPSLTRIEMPDDWEGHPQRKDYPLGGIPVEYQGRGDRATATSGGRTTDGTDTDRVATRHRRRAGLGRARRRRPRRDGEDASWSTWVRSTRPRTACCG